MAWFELVCGEIRDSLRGDRGLNCWKTGGMDMRKTEKVSM